MSDWLSEKVTTKEAIAFKNWFATSDDHHGHILKAMVLELCVDFLIKYRFRLRPYIVNKTSNSINGKWEVHKGVNSCISKDNSILAQMNNDWGLSNRFTE